MTSAVSIEQKLTDALAQRKPCDFSTGTDADRLDNSSQWGSERTIDSSLLRKILIDSKAGYGLSDQPLEINGARIDGMVDFRATSITRPIYFVKCVFTEMIDCTDARMPTMSLQECRLAGVRARYTQFDGSLLLLECQFTGPLDLESASVTRDVDLRGSKLSALAPINADRVDVGGSVYLRDGFSSESRISLEGAQIGSALDGFRGTFRNNNGIAVYLNAARIGGFCVFAFAELEAKVAPAVSAEGAQIGGFLSFRRAKVDGLLMLRSVQIGANFNLAGVTLANSRGTVLNLERANVGGDLLMNPHERVVSTVIGSMLLFNASIGGSVVIQGASIDAGDPATRPTAIAGEGLQVGHYLILVQSSVKGLVMLRDVQVARSVNLSGTNIDNRGAIALNMERAKVGGDMFIRAYERAGAPPETKLALVTGGIVMISATIGGSLMIIQGASIDARGEPAAPLPAIAGEGLQVGRHLNLGRSSIKGLVMLRDVQVARSVNLSGTNIDNPGALALNMERARIRGGCIHSTLRTTRRARRGGA
jgi:hypothetical protein